MYPPMTISAVCNFHREPIALPSFIKHAEAFFDEVVFVSSPPEGVEPCEESLEIIKASGHRLVFDTLAKGFGVLRTHCLRQAQCDWLMIVDADEIVSVNPPRLICQGDQSYPEFPNPQLTVTKGPEVNQKEMLKALMERANKESKLAICLSRRHWFDGPGEYNRPCQNWHIKQDWQLRCVANSPFLFYDPAWKIHEKLLLTTTWSEPPYLRADSADGPFFDHLHCFYKPQMPEKNTEDMATYRALDEANTKGMWLENADGVKA